MNISKKTVLIFLQITATVLISTFILWLPFLFRSTNWFGLIIKDSSFEYIYKNYDGPLYIIVAKTFYNTSLIENVKLELPFAPSYFSAHLPLYPLFIKLFYPLFGFLRSMIFVNILFTLLLALFFYFFITSLKISKKALALIFVFLFLPRFLLVRSIGAPESLFMLLILISLYFFETKKFLLAGLFGGLASCTKTPGVLLFFAYLLVFLEKLIKTKKINWSWAAILLIPLSLIAVFVIYKQQLGNFFAYFNKDSFVPLVFPFSVFNFQKKWVGTPWLEEIIFYFFFYLLTILNLKKTKYRSFFYFGLVFFIATTFAQHRDISRYSLPLWPLGCIAFNQFLTSKKFITALIILLPAIYLFAWNYLAYNTLPISDWQAFL